MARGVITMTTAPAGSGKTYRRGPHFLLTEFLPHCEGAHWSNLPLHVDKLAEEMARRTGRSSSEFLSRVKLIPAEVQQSWRQGESGPWEFFAEIDLQNAHVALDEFHEFCGTNKPKGLRERYQFWFGQIRHRGATIEVISQAPEKIAREIHYEAGIQLSLVNSEDRRDPWFRILLGDWYELRAKFLTGKYQSAVWEIEERKAKGKWIKEDARVFWLDAFYFGFYDSYSKPTDGNTKAMAQVREFEKRGRLGLLVWFARRNALKLLIRAAFVTFLVWFVCGGLTWLMQSSIQVTNQMVAKSMQQAAEEAAAKQPAATMAGAVTKNGLAALVPAGGAGAGATTAPSRPLQPAMLPPTHMGTATQPATQATDRASALQKELADVRGELAREKATRQELERRAVAAAAVVLMTRDSVTLRDGQTYRVGERVRGDGDRGKGGPPPTLEGRIVRMIDYERREVVFDDGSSVRLGGSVVSSGGGGGVRETAPDPNRGGETRPAPVPGVLQPAQPDGDHAGQGG